jgi:hypothetical protein
VTLGGLTFDSEREAARWVELLAELRAGLVSNLVRQKTIWAVIGGRRVFRYVADFVYVRAGRRVVEDVKSEFTAKLPTYRLKKKVLAALGVEITEVIR